MSISAGRYSRLLGDYLAPQRGRVAVLAVAIIATIALQLVAPQVLREFIDSARAGSTSEILARLAFAFLAIGVLNQVFVVLSQWQGSWVGWTATNQLRVDLARHLLGLEMSFHNERTPGELIERVDGDITALANFFSQFVIRIVAAALLVVGVIVILFFEDWRVGVAISIYAAVTVFTLVRMRSIAVEASEKERGANAALYGFIEERLAGIEDIRANGGGPYALRRLHEILRRVLHVGRRVWMRRSLFWIVLISLFTIGDVIALGYGSSLLAAGAVTIGTVFLFYQYSQLMWDMVDQIIQQMQDLQKAAAGIERVGRLMKIEPKMTDGDRTEIPGGALSVEFSNVSFSYNDRDMILDDVSFRLEAGRTMGLLGRTGSGKTTLTRLLLRLYDPTDGVITVGGIDPRSLKRSLLSQRVAMVTQEVQLFHASVRDNLTFFDSSIPDDHILGVIHDLELAPWFRTLPDGLDTVLGTSGGGLSAGEAQLLAFTRVFLRDPGLVVLDEPSSRLDPATEALLERAMMRLTEGRTAIIIAHRLSTVRRADEIMILDHGRIIEHGDERSLASDQHSRYSDLLRQGSGTGIIDELDVTGGTTAAAGRTV